MTLSEFLKYLKTDEAKRRFAEECGTSVGYLIQVATKNRQASGPLSLRIHEKSGYRVSLTELNPDNYPDESFTLDPLRRAS